MIAKKILTCCGIPEPISAATKLLLWRTDTPAGLTPVPLIGSATQSSGAESDGYGGALFNAYAYQIVDLATGGSFSSDFIVDYVFYGDASPNISDQGAIGELLFSVHYGSVYISVNGSTWSHVVAISGLPAGQNHVAFGRQSGAIQVWVNGSRIYRADDVNPAIGSPLLLQVANTGNSPVMIYGVRITGGADIYGDSSIISVPSLPLAII